MLQRRSLLHNRVGEVCTANTTVIRLKRDGHTVGIHCEKMKDAAHFKPFILHLKVVSLGLNEHGEPAESCVLVDSNDTPAPTFRLVTEHLTVLSTLNTFPNRSADRKDWLPLAGLPERTFDRRRKELTKEGFVEETAHGRYRMTSKGEVAIANESPTVAMTSVPDDVVATPHAL